MAADRQDLKLGIAGLGAIGLAVARAVDAGRVPGIRLAAASVRDQAKARRATESFRSPPALMDLAALAEVADVVVECLPSAQFAAVATPAIERGRIFMPLSVGMLINHMHLVDRARETGARIIVPTGALLGLDAVRATAEGKIASVKIVTRKPPAGLAGAPLLVERGISVEGLEGAAARVRGQRARGHRRLPRQRQRGGRAVARRHRPRSDALSRSGPIPASRATRTPSSSNPTASDLTMTIENIPSEENPRTGKITALSVLAALRRLTAPLVVGS